MAAFTVIEHVELGAAAATVTLDDGGSSIPTSYDHLLIKASIRNDNASYYRGSAIQLGTGGTIDTGSTYSNTVLYTTSSTPVSSREAARTELVNVFWQGNSGTADTFGNVSIWIPNYTASTFKQLLCTSCVEGATTTDAQWVEAITAGLWANTGAVTSVKMATNGSGDFMQYSTFTLYGVTGA